MIGDLVSSASSTERVGVPDWAPMLEAEAVYGCYLGMNKGQGGSRLDQFHPGSLTTAVCINEIKIGIV